MSLIACAHGAGNVGVVEGSVKSECFDRWRCQWLGSVHGLRHFCLLGGCEDVGIFARSLGQRRYLAYDADRSRVCRKDCNSLGRLRTSGSSGLRGGTRAPTPAAVDVGPRHGIGVGSLERLSGTLVESGVRLIESGEGMTPVLQRKSAMLLGCPAPAL